jgi:signal transduction histidine kinase
MITVEDNGVGMDESKVESIFKIDVSATTKGTDGEIGTGMGLLICKEMAELHGGDIIVKSAEGKGSAFTVKLPQ